jgi:hypothetical protein
VGGRGDVGSLPLGNGGGGMAGWAFNKTS